MKAALLAVGTELTTGQVLDTNTQWLQQQLFKCGVLIRSAMVVPDDQALIEAALKSATEQAALVIITGGLGPTADDLTRFAVAAVAGVELHQNEQTAGQIERFFASRSWRMSPTNLVQAMIPETGRPLPNSQGTAPGISIRIGHCQVFCLPGVPREMRAMYEQYVQPWILQHYPHRRVCMVRTLRCFGTGESNIGQQIGDLMGADGCVTIGTTASEGVISVHVRGMGDSESQVREAIEQCEARIRDRLGQLVFGVDGQTLAEVVGQLLRERQATLVTAESCTAGLLSKMVTDVAGSSEYFLAGYVCYSNQAKQQMLGLSGDLLQRHGAVSVQAAEAMAKAAKRLSGADLALSITGIAGPGGGSVTKPVGLVYLALAGSEGCQVHQRRFGSLPRDVIRHRSALTALNLLRLHLVK